MDKEAASVPGANAQPPPYSLVAPPLSNPTSHHHHSQHHPFNGAEPIVQTHIVTQQPGTTVVVTSAQRLGSTPTTMVCTACNRRVISRVIQKPTTRTHIWAIGLCIFGFWPCAPCIYCMDCCLISSHYVPRVLPEAILRLSARELARTIILSRSPVSATGILSPPPFGPRPRLPPSSLGFSCICWALRMPALNSGYSVLLAFLFLIVICSLLC